MPFPTQLAPMSDDWLIAKRQQAARANASMMDIIAELRADGLLKPMRRVSFAAPRMDGPEYVDNGWTVEAGE